MIEKGVNDNRGHPIREIIHIDASKAKQEAIEEAEQNGRQDIADELRRRRLSVDTTAIQILDEEPGEPIP